MTVSPTRAPAPVVAGRVGLLRLGAARPDPAPARRLLCIPYAGGNGLAYAPWAGQLGDRGVALYAVDLPGRLGRIDEPPYDEVDALVGDLCDRLESWSGPPYDLFGHSFGALVAFEVVRELHRRGSGTPGRLIVSGFVAPQVYRARRQLADLSDVELIDHLFAMDGTPVDARTEPALTGLLARTFRADLRIMERYRHRHTPPSDVPISVFAGSSDFDAELPAMRAWQQHTTRPVRLSVFPGGHFFPWQADGFVAHLGREVGAVGVGR